jgi:hypothetical protein
MLRGRSILRHVGRFGRQGTCFSTGMKVDPSGYFWAKQPKGESFYLVGVTEAFMKDKVPGDVDAVFLSIGGKAATSLSFNIAWSGLKIGEGDELYHSVWSNEEGTLSVDLQDIPFVPKNAQQQSVRINDALLKEPALLDEDSHILEISNN